MKLDIYDIAMVNGTCKEISRPLLQCLHLTKGRIEVADGFMLATRDLEFEKDEDKPETLLPAKMIKGVKAGIKQQTILKTDNKIANITYQDETGLPIDFEPSYSFKAYGDGKSYPNIDALFQPIKTEKTAYIAVGVGILKKLLSCMPNGGILRIGITEPTAPLEYECSNMDRPIRGLLMPMFIDWEDFKWHREPTSTKEKPVATH